MMEEIGEKLAQKQLDAYNEQDIEEFLSVYSEDVKIMEFPTNEISINGISEMRQRYSKLFQENPSNHADLFSRIVKGDYVIDHEYVSGRANGNNKHAVAIYQIEQDKISKVWFL